MHFVEVLEEVFSRPINEPKKYSQKDHQYRLRILMQLAHILFPSLSIPPENIQNPILEHITPIIQEIRSYLYTPIRTIHFNQAQQIIELLNHIEVDGVSFLNRYRGSPAASSAASSQAIVARTADKTPQPITTKVKFSSTHYTKKAFDKNRSFAQSLEMIFRLVYPFQELDAQATAPAFTGYAAENHSLLNTLTSTQNSLEMIFRLVYPFQEMDARATTPALTNYADNHSLLNTLIRTQNLQNQIASIPIIFTENVITRLKQFLPYLNMNQETVAQFPLLHLFLHLNEKASALSPSNIRDVIAREETDPDKENKLLLETIKKLLQSLNETVKEKINAFAQSCQSPDSNPICSFSILLQLTSADYNIAEENNLIEKIKQLSSDTARDLLGKLNEYIGRGETAACFYALNLLAFSGSAIALENIHTVFQSWIANERYPGAPFASIQLQLPSNDHFRSSLNLILTDIIRPATLIVNPSDFSNIKSIVESQFFECRPLEDGSRGAIPVYPTHFLEQHLPKILETLMKLLTRPSLDVLPHHPADAYAYAIFFLAHQPQQNTHTLKAKLLMGKLFSYGIERAETDDKSRDYLTLAIYYFLWHQQLTLEENTLPWEMKSRDYINEHIEGVTPSRFTKILLSSTAPFSNDPGNQLTLALTQLLMYTHPSDTKVIAYVQQIRKSLLDKFGAPLTLGMIDPATLPTTALTTVTRALSTLFSSPAQSEQRSELARRERDSNSHPLEVTQVGALLHEILAIILAKRLEEQQRVAGTAPTHRALTAQERDEDDQEEPEDTIRYIR